jgi:antitoxin component of RelBE/YafQ-DinJ toxin-antitoxin module
MKEDFIGVRVDSETKQKLIEKCTKKKMTLSECVRYLISKFIDE